MKKYTLPLAFIATAAICFVAYSAQLDQATKDDIARHRAMAMAHENAARCLESGQPDAVCEKQLMMECEGLAIGKFCGMKHTH